MAKKPFAYAVYEGIAQEMRKNPKLGIIWQLSIPVGTLATGEVVDLLKEFGPNRCIAAPIDEDMNIGWGIGHALTGSPAIVQSPSMTSMFTMDVAYEQCSKLRSMTGGQASMPVVLYMQGAGRTEGTAAQHNDVGQEAAYAWLPGVYVVCPTNAYDAKGLMTTALHSKDPVFYVQYSESGSSTPVEVPDDAYEVPFGKAAMRQEGKDLTLVCWAPATIDVEKAMPDLTKAGLSVEIIDLRSIKPWDTAMVYASVKKTGKLLVVEHGPYTQGFGSFVASEVAQFVPGVKIRRVAFPDAPGPCAKEMILWMRPDAPKIVDACTKFIKGQV